MRFKEFKQQKIKELSTADLPAITALDLKKNMAGVQATRNAVKTVQQTVGTTGKPSVSQAAGSPTAQQSALAKSQEKMPEIPSAGTTLALATLGNSTGKFIAGKNISGEIELTPVKKTGSTNDPKLTIKVKDRDLQNAIKAVSPETQDKRTL